MKTWDAVPRKLSLAMISEPVIKALRHHNRLLDFSGRFRDRGGSNIALRCSARSLA